MDATRRRVCAGLGALVLGAGGLAIPPVRRLFHPLVVRVRGRRTVAELVGEFAAAGERVRRQCSSAGIEFPSSRVTLVGLKQERRLEVYAGPVAGELRRMAVHPILAASGVLGPKLREGDRQVPEGIYRLESLNPNSRFHAALRVAYPNEFDRRMAGREGRTRLGGDIMIHGGASSVGCLAMGDPGAEDLFVLAAAVGVENVAVVLSPVDLRRRGLPAGLDGGWRRELYSAITEELKQLSARAAKREWVRAGAVVGDSSGLT